MKRYEYVSINSDLVGLSGFEGYREIIDDYASRGYRFVGYVPTTVTMHGKLVEIDLVFEIDADALIDDREDIYWMNDDDCDGEII